MSDSLWNTPDLRYAICAGGCNTRPIRGPDELVNRQRLVDGVGVAGRGLPHVHVHILKPCSAGVHVSCDGSYLSSCGDQPPIRRPRNCIEPATLMFSISEQWSIGA